MVKQNGPEEPPVPPQVGRGERHPLFGALKGTTFIPPGVDLTEPADPDWADRLDPHVATLATTTWSFSSPVNAFGGFWDLTPDGPGWQCAPAALIRGAILPRPWEARE